MAGAEQQRLDLDDDDPQARAVEATAHWIMRAREITGASAARLPVPAVRFDLRGRAAGQAILSRRRGDCAIRINAALLASHPREMLAETVPHEVAHVVVHRLFGRRARPHGREWKTLMRSFGLEPAPCHTLPAEPVRRLRRFPYHCACAEPAWLTSIRHKRALAGTAYLCRRCGQRLTPAPESEPASHAG